MSASVGLRLQLMMDNEGNYQETGAARSSTQVTCRLLRNYGNKKTQFSQTHPHLQPQVNNRPYPGLNPSRTKRQHMPQWQPATVPQVLKESHFLLRCLAFRPTLVHLLNSGRRVRVEMGCEGAAEVLTASLSNPSLLALMDSHHIWLQTRWGQGAAHFK